MNTFNKASAEQIALLREAAIYPHDWAPAYLSALTVVLGDHARMSEELERYRRAVPPTMPGGWMPLMHTGLGISFHVLDEHQARRNHGQTLARLAERGGLSPCEALAIAEKREWKSYDVAGSIIALSALAAPQTEEKEQHAP